MVAGLNLQVFWRGTQFEPIEIGIIAKHVHQTKQI
jgi:hypothetical protein